MKQHLQCLFCMSATALLILGSMYIVYSLGWPAILGGAFCIGLVGLVHWHETRDKREYAHFVGDMERRYRQRVYDFGRVNQQNLRQRSLAGKETDRGQPAPVRG